VELEIPCGFPIYCLIYGKATRNFQLHIPSVALLESLTLQGGRYEGKPQGISSWPKIVVKSKKTTRQDNIAICKISSLKNYV
jgi:hypothetical protein